MTSVCIYAINCQTSFTATYLALTSSKLLAFWKVGHELLSRQDCPVDCSARAT